MNAQAAQRRRTLRFEQDIDNARQARCQVLVTGPGVNDILVDADERSLRLPAIMQGFCHRRGLGLVTYRLGAGVTALPTLVGGGAIKVRPCATDDHPSQAVARILADLRAAATPAVFMIDYADTLLDADRTPTLDMSLLIEHLQVLTADVPGWQEFGLQLVLVDRGGGVNRRIVNHPGVRTVIVGPPDEVESTIFIRRAAMAKATSRLYLDPDLDGAEAGRLTRGLLNLTTHSERLASTASAPLTATRISAVKSDEIRELSRGTLELMSDQATFGTDVAGLPSVRLYLQDAKRIDKKTLRVLLSGPPGTGKTLCATAIGALLQVPVVRFGAILNEYLGASERNMTRALHVLRAMAPLVLFIDEADQRGLGSRGRGGEGHEAYQNLRGMLFEFMGDTGADTGISVVAATNVPSRLDEAARSRFSSLLPVLFASETELAQIMAIHARRAGYVIDGDLTPTVSTFMATHDIALSGRSALDVVEDARILAGRHRRQTITPGDVANALTRHVGNDWTVAAEYSTLTSLASVQKVDAWPWVAAHELGDQYDVPGVLRQYFSSNGQLDLSRVHARISTLEAAGVYQ
jgi:transitional endoplasmic reticulum ATPase